jgi:hypothetical protein
VHARDGATDLCHHRGRRLRDKRNKHSGDVVVAKDEPADRETG